MIDISWYDAISYCRILSETEGIPADQMCFPPIAEIGPEYAAREDPARPYGISPSHRCGVGIRVSGGSHDKPSFLEHRTGSGALRVVQCQFGKPDAVRGEVEAVTLACLTSTVTPWSGVRTCSSTSILCRTRTALSSTVRMSGTADRSCVGVLFSTRPPWPVPLGETSKFRFFEATSLDSACPNMRSRWRKIRILPPSTLQPSVGSERLSPSIRSSAVRCFLRSVSGWLRLVCSMAARGKRQPNPRWKRPVPVFEGG